MTDQLRFEYMGFRAAFEDPPSEEHLQKARELIEMHTARGTDGGSYPLDQWPEDPTLPDPTGQAVMLTKIT